MTAPIPSSSTRGSSNNLVCKSTKSVNSRESLAVAVSVAFAVTFAVAFTFVVVAMPLPVCLLVCGLVLGLVLVLVGGSSAASILLVVRVSISIVVLVSARGMLLLLL